ncbi:hypothetical protein GCM10009841_05320 [Microlunatus panaciterrae]|uniref:Thiol reductant ABC exporter CydD subunit n=1 Tax=Microlunatus panaciterrae TaxID=400768 RepID=A0ABS2RIL3_9ACTN|nr:thiol reductant ABC exporter subunit CydD [Microlunatus panaciterrae]MBM7798812.1 thiol reductant ABC exporter CydD subunit [Microlunatus panaciterrae]
MRPVDPRLLRRAGAVRGYLAAGVLIGTLLSTLVVLQAWWLATALGETFHRHTLTAVLAVLPLLAGGFIARALLTWWHALLAARTSAAVKSQLRTEITAAQLSRPDDRGLPTGALVTVMTQGLDALDGYFAKYLPQLVLAVTVPLVVGIAILSADPLSAVIVGLTLPLIPVFMILVGWMTEQRLRRRWRVQARLAHHFADLMAGLPTLQVFGRARAQAEGLRRIGEQHRRETMATLRVSFLSALVLELLATLSVAVVAVGIGLRVVDGQLSLTVALFVLILAPEAYLPLRQVGAHYHDAADGVAAVEQAFALIERPAVPSGHAEPPDLSESTVELVGLGVDFDQRPALAEVDLVIGPGEIVALVGPSGAGKSTLLRVLMGFRRADRGRVLVGGRELGDLDLRAWRQRLAWVAQRPALLRGSIADNVALGAAGAPRSRIEAALELAGAGGLDPDRVIEEDGVTLSSGEIRRVALARALLKIDCGGGQLLLLDEPTAGLDAATELVAIEALRSLGVGGLVVTHRDALAAAADRVVELRAPERTPA